MVYRTAGILSVKGGVSGIFLLGRRKPIPAFTVMTPGYQRHPPASGNPVRQ